MEERSSDDDSGAPRRSRWRVDGQARRGRWCPKVGLVAFAALLSCSVPDRPAVDADRDLAALIGSAEPVEFRALQSDGENLVAVPFEDSSLALPTAIERALRADAAVQSALARVRIAAAHADQERSLPNPLLS